MKMLVLSPVLRDIKHMCSILFDFTPINWLIGGVEKKHAHCRSCLKWHIFLSISLLFFQWSYTIAITTAHEMCADFYQAYKHIISQCCSAYRARCHWFYMWFYETSANTLHTMHLSFNSPAYDENIEMSMVLNKNKLFIKRLLCIAHRYMVRLLLLFFRP